MLSRRAEPSVPPARARKPVQQPGRSIHRTALGLVAMVAAHAARCSLGRGGIGGTSGQITQPEQRLRSPGVGQQRLRQEKDAFGGSPQPVGLPLVIDHCGDLPS